MEKLNDDLVEIEVTGMREILADEAKMISGGRINIDNIIHTSWIDKELHGWFDKYMKEHPSVNLLQL